jgi:very-short-patch-repair endonuclease
MSNKDDENLPRFAQTRLSLEIWAKLKPLVRDMRKEPTSAEDLLWQKLRKKQLGGYKFRRQHPVGYFMVDFYCADARLVIEVDGSIHEQQQEYDELRQAYIESLGLRVLRFENAHVVQQIQGVLERIAEALETPFLSFTAEEETASPHPSPLPASQGEGAVKGLDWSKFPAGLSSFPTPQEEAESLLARSSELEERAERGSREKFEAALSQVAELEPVEGDEL